MKKLLIAATVAATMGVTSGAWAACSSEIAMGGNKISGLADVTSANDDNDAATKAYVDAAGTMQALTCTVTANADSRPAVHVAACTAAGGRVATYSEAVTNCAFTGNAYVAPDAEYEALLTRVSYTKSAIPAISSTFQPVNISGLVDIDADYDQVGCVTP